MGTWLSLPIAPVPAFGVGAGNAAIVVDETANLEETAIKIRIGKLVITHQAALLKIL